MYFEFIAMCEELGIIPVIGLDFHDARTIADTADIVDYLYGEATTPYGALRKRDGHPKPYGSVWFQCVRASYPCQSVFPRRLYPIPSFLVSQVWQ